MVLRGKNQHLNKEDSYQVERPIGSLNADGEVDIPESCDVKETLLYKLEEIDGKINHLFESNKFFEQEILEAESEEDALELKEYIKENEDLVLDKKN
jgi:hypothetical protein